MAEEQQNQESKPAGGSSTQRSGSSQRSGGFQQRSGGFQQRGGGSRSGGRPFRGGNRRGRWQPRRKVCLYCVEKERVINWKNVSDLRRFTSDSGIIFPRRKTGLCAKHQRGVAVAIKRARHIALLPYTSEHVRVTGQQRS